MHSKVSLARGLLGVSAIASLGLVLPAGAAAQYEEVPRPAAYALQDVTVIQADGRTRDGMTLVVRGDLVEAMGSDVAVPADAKLLEGDSLVVYPGFVDGEGDADVDVPAPDIERSRVEIWNAPRVLQGFTPSRRVVDHLTSDGEDVADVRRAGIVAGAVHPAGGMMAGRGALLLYRGDAELPSRLVIDPDLGPTFTFRGGQGVYPGTLLGVMAFIRQAFEDTRHRAAVAEAHARGPSGLATPAYDPDYAVLQAVLDRDVPVFFAADEAAAILRVLHLADEYGFRPVIVGGAEAWKVAGELRRRDVPVLVSVDFDEPDRWDPDADAETLDAAAEREKQAFEDRWSNAGRLAEAGVTFALTSGGSGEVLEGARKAVEYGLAPEAALAALTAIPARLLGVPHIARLEVGLPATFVVADGPLFAEESEIRYAFVEGYLEEGEKPGPSAGAADEAASFGGRWAMTIDAQGQIMTATLVVEQEGATFSGSMTMMGQEMPLRDGVINGNELSATVEMQQGGETLDIELTGTVEGDKASGDADAGPLGMARWEAKRTGPGGGR